MRTILATVAIFLATLACPVPASADVNTTAEGYAGPTVCIAADRGGDFRIRAAIQAWNDTGTPVRLVRGITAGCTETMEIRLVSLSACPSGPCGGFGSGVGERVYSETYDRWAYRHGYVGLVDTGTRPEPCYALSLTTHEIGHALGLQHTTNRRSIMNPDYNHDRLCGAIGSVDVAALTALYTVAS